MESADLRDGDDPATWRRFDDSWLGTVVVKRLVWPRGVVVGEIRAQDVAKMSLAPNDDVVVTRRRAERHNGPRIDSDKGGRHRGMPRSRPFSVGTRSCAGVQFR
jgi:hypothetical protein